MEFLTRNNWEKEFEREFRRLEDGGVQEERVLNEEKERLSEAVRGFFDQQGAQEQWDYVAVEWASSELPWYPVVVDNPSVLNPGLVDRTAEIVNAATLDWLVRIEIYDNISEGIMVAGNDWGDVMISKRRVVAWAVEELRERWESISNARES